MYIVVFAGHCRRSSQISATFWSLDVTVDMIEISVIGGEFYIWKAEGECSW